MIYLKLFLSFLKIGILGFGGGLAILPMIYQSALNFTGMDPDTFANLFAVSQATPGPMAVNAATYVGFEVAGIPGAMAATFGVAFPSFVLIAIVIRFLEKYRQNKYINGAFAGIRPATVGLIASSVVIIGETALFKTDVSLTDGISSLISSIDVIPAIMAVVTLILAWKFKVGSIKLILIMGVLGIFLCSGLIF